VTVKERNKSTRWVQVKRIVGECWLSETHHDEELLGNKENLPNGNRGPIPVRKPDLTRGEPRERSRAPSGGVHRRENRKSRRREGARPYGPPDSPELGKPEKRKPVSVSGGKNVPLQGGGPGARLPGPNDRQFKGHRRQLGKKGRARVKKHREGSKEEDTCLGLVSVLILK